MSLFTAPEDRPFGVFHPTSRHHAFVVDDKTWISVSDYLEQRGPDLAEEATRQKILQNLDLRALLLGTGDTPLVVDGDATLGPVLERVRAELVPIAADAEAIQCVHGGATETERVCTHLLAERGYQRRLHRRFTGVGSQYECLCPACVAALPATPPLRRICAGCFEAFSGYEWEGDIGAPAHRSRPTEIVFHHEEVRVPLGVLRTLVPVAGVAEQWLALDEGGVLHRLDVRSGAVLASVPVPAELDGALVLAVAPGGAYAAVAERRGRRGVVVELATGRATLALLRDDYHEEHCTFPLAFADATRLVHGTEWNRLDVSDAATGELLTVRASPVYPRGGPSPPHYLDYFHSGLLVSPGGERVFANGWCWHPVGVPRVFSLRRWLEENVWESEDGPTVHTLCGRDPWDLPACWLEEGSVAVWGEGDEVVTPGVRIFDAVSGAELRAFAGPGSEGLFNDPPYLLAAARDGLGVWDPATGELLARDPRPRPVGRHPTSGELVSVLGPGELLVSRRV